MFGGDGFGPLLERLEAGDLVTILFQGLAVLTFDHGDPIGRDLVIASLVRLGLKGLTVATLCRVSPAHVSGVRRRVAAGGLAALAKRGTGGVAWTIQGAALARLRELHGQGASYGKIARRLRRPKSTVVAAVKRLEATALAADAQPTLPRVASAPPVAPTTDMARADSPAADLASEAPALIWGEDELAPGAWLPDGPAAHDSRYAGTLLLCAAADEIGVHDAITAAHVTRPETAIYPARQALTALLASWTSGSGSIEAMHERDAAALGIVLGLERSPSVRTLHRSIRQMTATYDAAAWSVALFHGVARAFGPRPVQLFGVDGHVKAYKGTAPIDKGWDSKRRLAVKALSEIRVSDDRGVTWWSFDVGAGDALSKHLVAAGTSLRGVMGTDRPLVLASDRGGFDFAVLDAIAREGLYYVAYVPASVTLPELDTIAPPTDGVGEQLWRHPRLHHPSRLLVERDAAVCVPATTNLPTLVAAAAAMELLRTARGWQENGIKAARAFAHIDGLVDRGGASYAPDDRLVRHPAHTVQHATRERALEAVEALAKVRPPCRGTYRIFLPSAVGTRPRRPLQAAGPGPYVPLHGASTKGPPDPRTDRRAGAGRRPAGRDREEEAATDPQESAAHRARSERTACVAQDEEPSPPRAVEERQRQRTSLVARGPRLGTLADGARLRCVRAYADVAGAAPRTRPRAIRRRPRSRDAHDEPPADSTPTAERRVGRARHTRPAFHRRAPAGHLSARTTDAAARPRRRTGGSPADGRAEFIAAGTRCQDLRGSLPIRWLGSDRAGFAPAGRRTEFHEVIATSFPSDQPCLVALEYLFTWRARRRRRLARAMSSTSSSCSSVFIARERWHRPAAARNAAVRLVAFGDRRLCDGA